jgi:hypothetical protein
LDRIDANGSEQLPARAEPHFSKPMFVPLEGDPFDEGHVFGNLGNE